MSNEFLPDLPPAMPGTVARSSQVNERYENTISAFDKLPAPALGKTGFRDPVNVGEPTLPDHAATKFFVETAMTSQVSQATTSAAEALASELAANNSASAALSSEEMAQKWAENPENVDVLFNQYSALHHSIKAGDSAAASEVSRLASELAQAQSEQARDNAQIYMQDSLTHSQTSSAASVTAMSARDTVIAGQEQVAALLGAGIGSTYIQDGDLYINYVDTVVDNVEIDINGHLNIIYT